ncbi:MAG: YciI family protein [Dokdonella sp.]|uniref:YciI family protein n=1 Tax=Dokdonella sp. TaxID=2291710 RepID=UPI003262FF07
MKFLVMIYSDETLVEAMPAGAFDTTMRECFVHADELKSQGSLIESQQLEPPATAKTIRVRNGRRTVLDGPFAEAKEMLGGFNVIEAPDMDEALRIAMEFPWAATGSIEVRPLKDLSDVRRRVGA